MPRAVRSRTLWLFVLCCSVVWFHVSGDAQAKASKSQKKAAEDRVRERAVRSVPNELSILSVKIPITLIERIIQAKSLSLHWRRSPRVGKVVVRVTMINQSQQRRSGWVHIELGRLVPVIVAARKLRQGHAIEPGDIVMKTTAVRDGQGWQLEPRVLLGAIVLRDIDRFSMLDASNVEAPMPVARGSTVFVTVRRGLIEVQTKGLLEDSRIPGSRVRVRLSRSHKVVSGLLVDASNVWIGEEIR